MLKASYVLYMGTQNCDHVAIFDTAITENEGGLLHHVDLEVVLNPG